MTASLPIVVSRSTSQDAAQVKLEADILVALNSDPQITLTVIPHLYHLEPGASQIRTLRQLDGDILLVSSLPPRAAHWTLDQLGIRGHMHALAGDAAASKTPEPTVSDATPSAAPDPPVLDRRPPTSRTIHHLELGPDTDLKDCLETIRKLIAGLTGASPKSADVRTTASAAPPNDASRVVPKGSAHEASQGPTAQPSRRRWYPVIDYSRCTNCLECIDFCLFGVYGIDDEETILVEQPDNCRQGCPACSRVCPEQAILFPLHKSPSISGRSDDRESSKLDLSQLFGQPDAISQAETERRQFQDSPRGPSAGSTPRSEPPPSTGDTNQPPDELDHLIDRLDELDGD